MRILLILIAIWPSVAIAGSVAIADLADLPAGLEVTVHGAVTMPPGFFGKSIFAMQDSSGRAGVIVRSYGQGDLPQLAPGDSVRVVGRIPTSRTVGLNTRPADVTILPNDALLVATPKVISEVSTADDGRMIEITGLVAARGKRWLEATDETASSALLVNLIGPEAPAVVPGDSLVVRGVVRSKTGAPEMHVTDLTQISVTRAASEPTSAEWTAQIPPSSQPDIAPSWPFLVTATGIMAAAWHKVRSQTREARRLVDS